jgi:hypothetical protein
MVYVMMRPSGVYNHAGYAWETPSILNVAFTMTGAVAGQSYLGDFSIEIKSNKGNSAFTGCCWLVEVVRQGGHKRSRGVVAGRRYPSAALTPTRAVAFLSRGVCLEGIVELDTVANVSRLHSAQDAPDDRTPPGGGVCSSMTLLLAIFRMYCAVLL